METCKCDAETYTGNTESVEDVLLCNICGFLDERATENNTILHDNDVSRWVWGCEEGEVEAP